MKKLILAIFALSSAACSQNQAPSGIKGFVNYETNDCKEVTQILNFQNNNTSEAKAFTGIYLEPGPTLNNDQFSLKTIEYNGQSQAAISNLAQEVLVPPGDLFTIELSYKPKEPSPPEGHVAVITMLLDMGIEQYEIRGFNSEETEGICEAASAGAISCVVNSATVTVVSDEFPEGEFSDTVTSFSQNMVFIPNEGEVSIDPDGFPDFTIKSSDPSKTAGVEDLPVDLAQEAIGTLDEAGNIDLPNSVLSVAGLINVVGNFSGNLNDGVLSFSGAIEPNAAAPTLDNAPVTGEFNLTCQ